MQKQRVLEAIESHVRAAFADESTGHDWWHIARVHAMALRLAHEEGADPFIVSLGALLHDIADWKFHAGDDTVGPRVARELLAKQGADQATLDHVSSIVADISFKGAGVKTDMATLEGKVVQDADRLDAIGAIGIARTFVYTGYKKRPMHNPSVQPEMHADKHAYFKGGQTTINHFYEKLLLLKDRMQTESGKRLAQQRHMYMENYLKQFFAEWDGHA